MSLFGSSGIRGVIGEQMTVDLALAIGKAMGSLYPRTIIGMDTRTSGDMVLHALTAGITSAGGHVWHAGMVATPTLARATKRFDCGLMVTASHNPPEYNGVKMWNPDGSAFDSAQMVAVEERIRLQEFRLADWSEVGRLAQFDGAMQAHVDAILADLPTVDLEVVLDCGNGATCLVSPLALRSLGCKVMTLNSHPDGFFPGRPSEPTEDNLSDLKVGVLNRSADMGIAHDGDGDRMVAIDEKGRYIDGDRLLALFASHLDVMDVVAPVDASMVLDDIVPGKVIRTRVGDVYVSEALKLTHASFGGEPSGTFIFPKQSYCPDGVYAAAFLASIVQQQPLSEMVDALPSYPVARRSYVFKEGDRRETISRLQQEMETVECDELTTVDGFRARYGEGWFLVRLSGTEPKIRLSAEAREMGDLDKLVGMAERVIRRCL